MKKVFFVLVFVLLATAVFAQRSLLLNDVFNTSEGNYAFAMFYEGRNVGQQLAIEQANNPMTSRAPLSRGQLDVIKRALARYQNRIGDTYLFFLTLSNNPYSRNNVTIAVVVEITNTAGGFSYWAYRLGLQ